MKMIASRELSARPAAVWADLETDGVVVVTRDGLPVGIITPTSADTILQDMREIAFAKARGAVASIRAASGENGTQAMGMEEIDAEIRNARKARKPAKSSRGRA